MCQAVALTQIVNPVYCISYVDILFPPSLHFFVFIGTLLLAHNFPITCISKL